jgi:hypothetical protein
MFMGVPFAVDLLVLQIKDWLQPTTRESQAGEQLFRNLQEGPAIRGKL